MGAWAFWSCFIFLLPYLCTAENCDPKPKCPSYLKTFPLNITQNLSTKIVLSLVDKLFAQAMTQYNLPGMIVTLVYDQDIAWWKGYGSVNPFNGSTNALDLDSVVRVGSITKVFTDLMLLKIRDAGIVSLDTPLKSLIKNFTIINPYNTRREITLRQLGSHTSGLPRDPPCPYYNWPECNEDEVLEGLSNQTLLFPPYSTARYCNLCFSLMGNALGQIVNQNYGDYIQNEILKPLGMTSSGFDWNDSVKQRLAVGVEDVGNDTRPALVFDLGYHRPTGGLFSTARDISKLISLMFRNDKAADGGSQILDGSTIEEMFQPVHISRDGATGFALPWEFKYYEDYIIKGKYGQLPGYRSQIMMIPELKLGMFVSITQTVSPSPSNFVIDAFNILVPALEAALLVYQPPPSYPLALNIYTGVYKVLTDDSKDTIFIRSKSDGSLIMRSQFFNATYALTMEQTVPNALRLNILPIPPCDLQVDSEDLNFLFFEFNADKTQAEGLYFQSEFYIYQTKPTKN